MKLNPIAANQTEVEHDNGVTIFFSSCVDVEAGVMTAANPNQ